MSCDVINLTITFWMMSYKDLFIIITNKSLFVLNHYSLWNLNLIK